MTLAPLALNAARTAIAKAALIAEDRADSLQSMGQPYAMATAQRDADRLWASAFDYIVQDGCVYDRRKVG
jgi:hypothetical protein